MELYEGAGNGKSETGTGMGLGELVFDLLERLTKFCNSSFRNATPVSEKTKTSLSSF